MAQFSIDSDISPLKRRHFGSASRNSLSSQDRGYLDRQFGKAESDQLDRNFDIAMKMDQKRSRDLQYQMNLETLQKRRDDAARERDLESRIPQLVDQINGIRGSEEDPSTKAQALTDLQMQNPYLANTSLGSKILGTAYAGLDVEAQARIKRENKEKEERAKAIQRLSPYVDTGGVEQVTGIIDEDGVRTPEEQEALKLAQYNLDRGLSTSATATQKAQRGALIKQRNEQIKSNYTALQSLGYDTEGGGLQFDESGNAIKPSTPQASTPKLTPKSRRGLEIRLARIYERPLSDIRDKKLSDEALQDALMDANVDLEIRLQSAQFSSIQDQSITPQTRQAPTSSQWDLGQ